jgi:glycosyltransferase involved in cell wall biosynthesis
MKKFLLISYYWPPAGGGGVQRWLKMSKYIPAYGWQPIVYTAKPAEYVAEDQKSLSEVHADIKVIRKEIWEPYDWYKRLTGKKKNEKLYSGFISDKPSKLQQLAVYIRGNYFIPDARKFWIRPSIRFLSRYLKENPVDAIISTGPPHSMHLIALGLKKRYAHIPWIADFRDPWTQIDFYSQLKLSAKADRKHKRLESEVLTYADQIVTVSKNWQEKFRELSGRNEIQLIHNGFDPADFQSNKKPLDKFSICHVGSMNKDRNPENFWKAIKRLIHERPEIKNELSIELIGPVDHSINKSISGYGISECVNLIPFIPHQEVVHHLSNSQILFLPINNSPNNHGIIPGKVYEYLAAKRPILCIGPTEGDAAQIISNCYAGKVFNYKDENNIYNCLLSWYLDYKAKGIPYEGKDIDSYSRKFLAEKYVTLLNKLV